VMLSTPAGTISGLATVARDSGRSLGFRSDPR
jgi:hypothetical protein